VPNYLIRLQLPDRPGALGAVASRIGSVGGDVVSIDILQRDNGAVVDELGVGLAGDHLLGLLRDEILEVDGVSIEALRAVVGPLPDRHAELLDIATELFVQASPEALLDHLADRVRRSLAADFAAIIDVDSTRVTGRHGDAPSDDQLRAMALWAVAPLSSPVGADEIGTGSPDESPGVAVAEMVRAGVVLVVGRSAPVLRSRERQWIAIMAELADHGWRELA
jgi:AcrR family transcriptional regulator